MIIFFFFFNDTATTEIYTLSLHDALPIWPRFEPRLRPARRRAQAQREGGLVAGDRHRPRRRRRPRRGGHHASAGVGGDRKSTRLESRHLVISDAGFCLETKKKKIRHQPMR